MDRTSARLAPSVDRSPGRSPESPAPVVLLPESFRGRLLLRRPGRAEISPTGVVSEDHHRTVGTGWSDRQDRAFGCRRAARRIGTWAATAPLPPRPNGETKKKSASSPICLLLSRFARRSVKIGQHSRKKWRALRSSVTIDRSLYTAVDLLLHVVLVLVPVLAWLASYEKRVVEILV